MTTTQTKTTAIATKGQVASGGTTTAIAVAPKVKQMRGLIGQMEAQIKTAIPKYLDSSRFVRVILTLYSQNKNLWGCSDISFLAAVMTAAQLGLEPDGILGEGYIIPYGERAQFQIGYKGLLKLARNSGNVKDVQLEAVYVKDKFRHTKGLNPVLEHESYEGEDDPGLAIRFYMIVRFMNGGFQYKVMSRSAIERHRNKYSKAYNRDLARIEAFMKEGKGITREKAIETLLAQQKLCPWFSNEEAMMKKTVAIQCCKLLDLSPEARKMISREEHMEQGITLPVDTSVFSDADTVDALAEDVVETQENEPGESKSDKLANRLKADRQPGDDSEQPELAAAE